MAGTQFVGRDHVGLLLCLLMKNYRGPYLTHGPLDSKVSRYLSSASTVELKTDDNGFVFHLPINVFFLTQMEHNNTTPPAPTYRSQNPSEYKVLVQALSSAIFSINGEFYFFDEKDEPSVSFIQNRVK